jgi:quercetin dioxygenase-like cupin family protein
MRIVIVLSIVLLAGSKMSAQAQAPAAANNANPGVNPIRLMDRPEVRVTRVEIQPGGVRTAHTHDDVRFHLWIPVSGKLELTIGSAKPVAAASGQAFFMQKGTPHGFKNVGNTTAAVMEIFVLQGASAAEAEALGVALAAAAQTQDLGPVRR